MQHFDNLDHYTEQDFDDYTRCDDFGEADLYYSRGSKKSYYEEETKQFYFVYEDSCEDEQELFTTIECIWKVTPPDYSSWDSDLDYYGYTELTAWKVISVENSDGDEVEPVKVLTVEQLENYNAAMLNFIEE